LNIVCFLSFGAWNLLNLKTLLDLDTHFAFFNIFVGHDTDRQVKSGDGRIELKQAITQHFGQPFE
jgi:hypothetical protein